MSFLKTISIIFGRSQLFLKLDDHNIQNFKHLCLRTLHLVLFHQDFPISNGETIVRVRLPYLLNSMYRDVEAYNEKKLQRDFGVKVKKQLFFACEKSELTVALCLKIQSHMVPNY